MSKIDARQPPRFVPTLTDVVPETAADIQENAAVVVAKAYSAIGQLDTLHEPPGIAEADGFMGRDPEVGLPLATDFSAQHTDIAWAQAVQQRVMDRVSASIEERLRYAMADMVQLHTQALYQAIRKDVEIIVKDAVYEAVAVEQAALAEKNKS